VPAPTGVFHEKHGAERQHLPERSATAGPGIVSRGEWPRARVTYRPSGSCRPSGRPHREDMGSFGMKARLLPAREIPDRVRPDASVSRETQPHPRRTPPDSSSTDPTSVVGETLKTRFLGPSLPDISYPAGNLDRTY
jgi:hypothetical protein